MTAPPEQDPLEDVKAPALSFKDAPIGTVRCVTVTDYAKKLQSRDFDTGEPDWWPPDANGHRNPKMAVVIDGTDENGQPISVWAGEPSAMRNALVEAQKQAGQRIAPGGKLWIKFTGEEPPPPNKKNHNPKKLYQCVYQPGPPPDALAQQPAQPPAQQQYQQTATPQQQPAAQPQYQPPAQQQYQQPAQPPFQQPAAPQPQAAGDPWGQAPPQGDPFANMPAATGDHPPF